MIFCFGANASTKEVPVWSRNSSNTVPARWNMGCTPESHYPPRVRRLTGSTILDQNRSCIITLSMPNTMIVSHRPELTHKNMVSCCPSMRLSALSAEHDKAHQRRDLVTVPAMSLADCDCFFGCAVISERKPDKSDGDIQDVVAQHYPERQQDSPPRPMGLARQL